jgi:uncharacterized radical SAM superfamily protein
LPCEYLCLRTKQLELSSRSTEICIIYIEGAELKLQCPANCGAKILVHMGAKLTNKIEPKLIENIKQCN